MEKALTHEELSANSKETFNVIFPDLKWWNVLSIVLLFASVNSPALLAQTQNNQETHQYRIFRTSEDIRVDGDLSEDIWQSTDKVGPFWYSFPVDDKAVEEEHHP